MNLLNSIPLAKSLLEELGNTHAANLPLDKKDQEHLQRLRERKLELQKKLNP